MIVEEEEEGSNAGGWSDLHPDLLAEIFRHLDVADYIRCMSVCASWGSVPEKTMNFCKPERGSQPPWLLITATGDKPFSGCFHCQSCFHAKMAKHTLRLPQIAYDRCIGSSQGFLIITVHASARLCARNPLTGARFPLPPTATHPDILIYDDLPLQAPPRLVIPSRFTKVDVLYRKAVISPSLDTIVVAMFGKATKRGVFRYFFNLAFARAGDDSWTALLSPSAWIHHIVTATDLIFHKGLLYVLYINAHLVVFNLENLAAPPLVSPKTWPGTSTHRALLTETPDGEDLLLVWRNSTNMGVFKLDKTTLEWNQVQSIGGVALFLDRTHLSSLSTREFPCLKSNCVYFTVGNVWPDDDIKHIGVYNLDDGSIHPLSHGDDLGKLYQHPFIWFTPAL